MNKCVLEYHFTEVRPDLIVSINNDNKLNKYTGKIIVYQTSMATKYPKTLYYIFTQTCYFTIYIIMYPNSVFICTQTPYGLWDGILLTKKK